MRNLHNLRVQAIAGITLLAATMLFAQSGKPPTGSVKSQKQEAAPLRAISRLVHVSVIVRDSRGAPVTGLTKEDFKVFDAGEEQPVRFFSVADRRTSLARPAAPEVGLTFSNRIAFNDATAAPVSYVILFDGLNTRVTDQAYARQNIVRFLQSIQPGELVAVYVLGNGLTVAHDFTTDIAELQRTTAKLSAFDSRFDTVAGPEIPQTGSPLFDEFASVREKRIDAQFIQNRVRTTLRAIEAIARHLHGVPGRKNLMWVSASFPLTIGMENPEASFQRFDLMRNFTGDVVRAMNAVNNANVAIYPIDSRGLVAPMEDFARTASTSGSYPITEARVGSRAPGKAPGGGGGPSGGGSSSGGGSASLLTDSSPRPAQAPNPFAMREVDNTRLTMREIADLTGGIAYYNTNDLAGALREAMNDSQITYVLGYYPTHNKWDGQFRETKVQVRQSGAQVRYRRGYFAMPDAPPVEQKGALEEAASAPVTASAVGVTANFDKSAEPDSYRMRIRVNPREISLVQKDGVHSGAVELHVESVDTTGRALWKDAQHVTLNLKPATYERTSREGLLFRVRVPKTEGATEIRAVVRDPATGSYGTLRIPLAALRNALLQ